jgi:hypothetical protein
MAFVSAYLPGPPLRDPFDAPRERVRFLGPAPDPGDRPRYLDDHDHDTDTDDDEDE